MIPRIFQMMPWNAMSFQMLFWFNEGKVCQKLWSNDLKIGFWIGLHLFCQEIV